VCPAEPPVHPEIVTSITSDRELMAQVDAGVATAFGELYDRFWGRAYRVALSVCRDEGYAQDAVQEAFLSIWASPAGYRSQRGTVAAWLLTGVRYRAIDVIRRNAVFAAHRSSSGGLEERPASDDVSEKVIQRDSAVRLRASMATLPDRQCEVITLAYYGELTHAEIAEHLGLPTGTVKGRMRLGLQKLRALEFAA
jgi:RNA polymerase sigma-70 factor (ECF subfamily)